MAYVHLNLKQANGNLPMICMRCGKQATVFKAQRMLWLAAWIYWLVLVNPVLCLIVACLARKEALLRAPFCNQCQGHWPERQTFMVIALIGMIGNGLGVSVILRDCTPIQFSDFVLAIYLGGIIAVVTLVIPATIAQVSAIRPVEITKTHILLAGVSERFVQAVEDAEMEHRILLRLVDRDAQQLAHHGESQDAIQDQLRARTLPPSTAITE